MYENAVANAEQFQCDQITLELIKKEFVGVIIGILSSLLVLISGLESRELIARKYRPPNPDDKPLYPAQTALESAIVASISLIILASSAWNRYEQRQLEESFGIAKNSIWPNILFCIGFGVSILATGIKNVAVAQRAQEEAQAVIF